MRTLGGARPLPRASPLSRYTSTLSIAHIRSDCTKALALGPWVLEGTPSWVCILPYPTWVGRDRATGPSPPPKIALSHHVARAAPHQPQIPLKSNPHPAPSRMAPPPATSGLSAGPGSPMKTRTIVLHSDRDNHKSPNNETGAGNTESDRVLIG